MSTTELKKLPEPPREPRRPEPNECCGTGCIPCVMDLYEEDLEQYRQELAAWTAALAAAESDGSNIPAVQPVTVTPGQEAP